jgi:hypothetical protein
MRIAICWGRKHDEHSCQFYPTCWKEGRTCWVDGRNDHDEVVGLYGLDESVTYRYE